MTFSIIGLSDLDYWHFGIMELWAVPTHHPYLLNDLTDNKTECCSVSLNFFTLT